MNYRAARGASFARGVGALAPRLLGRIPSIPSRAGEPGCATAGREDSRATAGRRAGKTAGAVDGNRVRHGECVDDRSKPRWFAGGDMLASLRILRVCSRG